MVSLISLQPDLYFYISGPLLKEIPISKNWITVMETQDCQDFQNGTNTNINANTGG